MRSHWGRKVLEVRPPVELNKGRGVERLLRERRRGRGALRRRRRTDVDAFAALRARGRRRAARSTALCVGVRSDETPEELDRPRPTCSSTGPPACAILLEALAAA